MSNQSHNFYELGQHNQPNIPKIVMAGCYGCIISLTIYDAQKISRLFMGHIP